MKSPSLVLVFALTTLRGAEPPLPEFTSNTIGHPPLSLGELGKGTVNPMRFGPRLPSFGENARPASARIVPSAPRFAPKSGPWKMPILEPDPNIDYKIVLKEPDPTIDFKMLIRPAEPERKSTK